MSLKNKCLERIRLFVADITEMPVTIKVTLYYTVFLTLLLLVTMAGTVQMIHLFEHRSAMSTLTKAVDKAARHPTDFEAYDKNIYLAIHDYEGRVIAGAEPAGFPNLEPVFGKGPSPITVGNMRYQIMDMPIRPEKILEWRRKQYRKALEKGLKDVENPDETFRPDSSGPGNRKNLIWVRGVMEYGAYVERFTIITRVCLLILPVFAILVAAGGYRIIRRGFAPVASMSSTARSIGETGDLSKRLPVGNGKDEIHQMGHTLNYMLDQISELVERERRFTSDVSHELRTPIAIIMAESEYGKDYTEDVEEAKKEFQRIFEQSRHLNRMINQLLEITRLGNKSSVPLKDTDLSSIVSSIAEDYQKLPESQKLKWDVRVTPGCVVKGDDHLFSRIFVNYLDNAMKFTHSFIRIALERNADKVILSVTDDGDGMDKETLLRIWDRLYQADSSRNRKKNSGLGLGLSFVAIAAKLLKARAYASSRCGGGSTFYLEFSNEEQKKQTAIPE